MDDTLLHGYPFRGCSIIYHKSLSDKIIVSFLASLRFCVCWRSFTSMCVLFSNQLQSSDAFLGVLGEIEGLIDSISFGHWW